MKAHPILFSTAMIQAIMAGRKTQTRREVKSHNPEMAALLMNLYCMPEHTQADTWKDELIRVNCPYGKLGDVLWVRESWQHSDDLKTPYLYRQQYEEDYLPEFHNMKWKPSIHMPRSACRLFLKITDIKVERLQDISEDDAVKEGVESKIADRKNFGCRAAGMQLYRNYERNDNSLINYPCNGFDNAKDSFQTLWQSINGPESWQANPWVFAISFERIDKPANW